MKAYKLTPSFKDVLWGGTAFSDIYGMTVPTKTTGEAFVASVVPGYISMAEGESFADITANAENTGACGFNLLFKLIDAKKPLSVQVHPNDEEALALENGRGKTECWYVLSAKEGAFLYLGFKKGVTKEQVLRFAENGKMEELLNRVPVKAGDFFLVPAGTVHAIGEGVLIAELQQSSDITYRVYDYNRRDGEGRLRPLHMEKALRCMSFAPYENAQSVLINGRERLCKCPFFTVERVQGELSLEDTRERYKLLFFEEGEADIVIGMERFHARAGETYFVPASVGAFEVRGKCRYLAMYE